MITSGVARPGRLSARRAFVPAVVAGAVFGAAASWADDAPPVVVEQVEGDANGLRVQLQVQIQAQAEAPPPAPAVGAGFGDAVGELLRAAINAAAPAAPAEAADPAEPAVNPARAAELQRQAQVKQAAKQFEQFMQPVLRGELELIRGTCGELPPPARRAILAAGQDATTKAALAFAQQQVQGNHGRKAVDPRAMIREQLAGVVRKEAGPAASAAYDSERKRRDERRAEAARVRIVGRLDSQLELTAEQRAAIERDLEARWQPAWIAMLDDQGMVINGRPLAPDFCDACVRGHLGADQLRQWDLWRKAAGTAVAGWGWSGGMSFDGQGLQQADGWWRK